MLANKYQWDVDGRSKQSEDSTPKWKKLIDIDPEAVVENITNIMFKCILILGVPYFLFVLIRFLMLG